MDISRVIPTGPVTRDQPVVFKRPTTIRDLKGLSPVLARSGSLELRLATTKKEIRKAQRLRYQVFYEEGDAVPDAYMASLRRDTCAFDRICDHLLVVETAHCSSKEVVVGTTRLLRNDQASAHYGFYSESEFVLEPFFERHAGKRFLELGRSCVHPDFRAKRVIHLLWQGVGLYAAHHRTDVLIGCSSFSGTHPETLSKPLSFIYHYAASPAAWQVCAMPDRCLRMNWLEKAAFDPRTVMATLPPLIKAYVRAGGTFAAQAAVDYQFGTTDLFTVMPLTEASVRYLATFAPMLSGGSPQSGINYDVTMTEPRTF